ncbi:MAG: HAD family hydrolase [Proteobacteria bacterium]|nr:HAD family hydrolase [Pseudomonadota bacterium]
MKSCVVLFDIDGTLLTGPDIGPSAGYRAMIQATEQVAGRMGNYEATEFAGRTDLQIARALLVSAGKIDPPSDLVTAVVDQYVELLEVNVKATPYSVLGFPQKAVEQLRLADAVVALGTGNVRAGGAIKLTSAGIGELFDMGIGGFGDDGDTRADLLRAGAQRCDPSGDLPIVVIGDTPYDIAAAHEIGAHCIGVPYRHNDAETLNNAGADVILEIIDTSLLKTIQQLISS